MKKLVFSIMIVASFAFVGCSDDDDVDENKCASCDLLGVSVEACDNGDGTVTVSAAGESQVLSGDELEGQSATEYVQALEDGCGLLSN